MSTSMLACETKAHGIARFADFAELTKPRIMVMVLIVVTTSAFLAAAGSVDMIVLLNTMLGTTLVAASASALNQWLERETDRRMRRTAARPLPMGRLKANEVLTFGVVTITAGTLYLALTVNLTCAAFALTTWILYVWVYTPLKSRSSANTLVGAIPGALPVLIGWSAMRPDVLTLEAFSLFAMVFLWQFPHFMAIAWIYRRQYRRAGLRMLTVVDPSGRRAAITAIATAALLVPASIMAFSPSSTASWLCVIAIAVLGAAQLACATAFWMRTCEKSARLLLRASLVYLPIVLALWILFPVVS
ncbi:MAG: heme o synthase [Vibrio fluvialis]